MKKVLDKIINAIRISPIGAIPPLIGIGLITDQLLGLGLSENIPKSLQNVEEIVSSLSFFPLAFYGYGLERYNDFKKIIKENGIDKRHVEKNLKHYCDRQAYKAAAYKEGKKEEFDKINKIYNGEKLYKWIPEI